MHTYHPDPPRPPAIPEVCSGGAELPVHLPALRPVQCTLDLYQDPIKPVAALLREHGVRLVVYIDDILVMAETKELAAEHTTLLASLLKNLGFLLSEKSVFHPAQAIEFLGMVTKGAGGKRYKRLGRQPETS